MGFPIIPSITPDIDISIGDVTNLLLASIAFEELGLAHIVNAEAEKIQFILGTLETDVEPPASATLDNLLDLDAAVGRILERVIAKEIILLFKLDKVFDFLGTTEPEEED